jgi:hypothetical protein
MLMIRCDELELDSFRAHKLHWLSRIIDPDATLTDEFDGDACFLGHLTDGGLVRQFIGFDMASRRQPDAQLGVWVENDMIEMHHEHGDREIP